MRIIYFCFWLSVLLATTGAFAQIVISEFMASNTQSLADEDGEYADWIEVLNTSGTNVNLNGWALTDNPSDPRKWRFPAMEIGPGQALVVFASNKDRRVPGNPLHTDFRLSAGAGYLGLANAAGIIVSDFGASYPAQLPDVSYGIVGESSPLILVGSNATVRAFAPVDGSLDGLWNLADFSDVSWISGTNGLGSDRNPGSASAAWEPAIYYSMEQSGGLVITNSGSKGAAEHGTAVGGLIYNQSGPRPPEWPGLPEGNIAMRFNGRDDYITTGRSTLNDRAQFTMCAWVRPFLLTVPRSGLWGQHGVIEFGLIDSAVLQLSSPVGGTVQVPYPFAANEWHHVATVGDGSSLRIYLDGVLVAEGGNNAPFYGNSVYPLNLAGGGIFDPSGNFFNGFLDEFALFERALTDDEIARYFQSAQRPDATYLPEIRTELSAVNSAYARFSFSSAAGEYAPLVLRVQHDDGFAAYLNGVEVARQNAPVEVHWNSTAAAERPGAVGLIWQEFDLSAYTGLLTAGTNLLAVQVLNASPGEPDLFLRAELIGFQQAVQTNSFRYFLASTPGAINGIGETNLGPLVLDAKHAPELPANGDPILVTARVQQTFNPPANLALVYRVMFGTETTLPMLDNGQSGDGPAGDGVYGATIPASASNPGQMVRWFLRATDNKGLTTRWPPYRDTRNSPQYLGTVIQDPSLTNPLPVLHWFIQSAGAADSTGGTRASLFWNGELYDNIFVNLHGQSSQGFPKKSYNFDFNRGFKFQYAPDGTPVEDINLLTTYPDKAHIRNILAYESYRDAGHPYHFVIPVRVQRNGAFFSDAHMVEDAEEEYLERVGLDPLGALYKMYNSLDTANTGAEKKTRKFEGNNDLQRLVSGINLAGAARNAFIYDNIDLPSVANYLAAMILVGNNDCCHKNYYLYRDSAGNGEWTFLPWDLDLSFGRNWTGSATYFDDTMYVSNPLFVGGNNRLISVLFGMQDFRQMYLRRIRSLMDELLQPPGTPAAELKYERRIRELYEQIGPDAALDFAKWPTWGTKQTMAQALGILTNQYLPGRRNFLYVSQRSAIPAAQAENVGLRISALEFNPSSGLQAQEYLALVNTNNVAVDISGWKVGNAVEHTFDPGTVIAANRTLYLSPDVTAFRLRSNAPSGGQSLYVQGNYLGQLSARGETVVVTDTSGRIAASLTYEGSPTPWQQALRVSEVMFAPASSAVPGIWTEDLEYIVLRNTGDSPLNLNGVRFDSGITFTLASDVFLEASEKIYVAKNPDAFRAYYGTNYPVAGPYVGQLSNSGETIGLYDPVGEKVLDFAFDREWFPGTEGHSLQVMSQDTLYSDYDVKRAWAPSAHPGGSAGLANAWRNYASGNAEGDDDHDGQSNLHEFTFGTDAKSAESFFDLLLLPEGIVRFTAAPGRVYTLLRSDDLAAWKVVATLPRSLERGFGTFAVEGSADAARAFYKIQAAF